MNTRKKYSKEFKLDAISLVLDQGCTRTQAASSLCINTNMLGRWLKEQQSDDGHAFRGNGKLTPDQEEIRKLRTQVKRLEMEKDILKKATVDSIGHCNRCIKILICRGLLDETHIYRRRTRLCF
jgi:transposase